MLFYAPVQTEKEEIIIRIGRLENKITHATMIQYFVSQHAASTNDLALIDRGAHFAAFNLVVSTIVWTDVLVDVDRPVNK
jgi:hypothetical protein